MLRSVLALALAAADLAACASHSPRGPSAPVAPRPNTVTPPPPPIDVIRPRVP